MQTSLVVSKQRQRMQVNGTHGDDGNHVHSESAVNGVNRWSWTMLFSSDVLQKGDTKMDGASTLFELKALPGSASSWSRCRMCWLNGRGWLVGYICARNWNLYWGQEPFCSLNHHMSICIIFFNDSLPCSKKESLSLLIEFLRVWVYYLPDFCLRIFCYSPRY